MPISHPCSPHQIFQALIPLAKPITVRLSMIPTARYQTNGPEEAARRQHTIPNSNPSKVVLIRRFALSTGNHPLSGWRNGQWNTSLFTVEFGNGRADRHKPIPEAVEIWEMGRVC